MMSEKQQYAARLEGMPDADLQAEAERYIWLSAFAANNPRSDFHWKCDMTFAEARRRGKEKIYERAHKSTMRGDLQRWAKAAHSPLAEPLGEKP